MKKNKKDVLALLLLWSSSIKGFSYFGKVSTNGTAGDIIMDNKVLNEAPNRCFVFHNAQYKCYMNSK